MERKIVVTLVILLCMSLGILCAQTSGGIRIYATTQDKESSTMHLTMTELFDKLGIDLQNIDSKVKIFATSVDTILTNLYPRLAEMLETLEINSDNIECIVAGVKDHPALANAFRLIEQNIGEIVLTGKNSCSTSFATKNAPKGRRHGRAGFSQSHPIVQHRALHTRGLNLTGAQEKKIETLMTSYQKAVIDKQAQLSKLTIDKKNALRAENYTQVKRIIDNMSKVSADIEKLKVDLMSNVSKELTAEQREQIRKRK
jgi:Spy/CpxP family protein refolding chaperone